MSRFAPTTRFVGGVLAIMIGLAAPARVAITRAETQDAAIFRPALAVPELLAPFVKHLEPGNDVFPAERVATELERRLGELSEAMRARPDRMKTIADWLLADDFRGARLRPLERGGGANYHALQTSLNRRFDNGFMFGMFYVWSKTLGINNDDFTPGVPNQSEAETRRLDYSYIASDRPHNFVVNFVYQTPKVASGALSALANDWQVSGLYRWTSGRPYNIAFNIPGIDARNLTGTDGNPNARVVLTCDPGSGSSSDPYRQINTACFAPPQPGSDGAESARFFLHAPAINNIDLSLSKRIRIRGDIGAEVRLDIFNFLNHTQFTGVNNTVNFKSLSDPTIENLPYDASGNLVNQNGFGTINGVAPPRQLQLVMRLTF